MWINKTLEQLTSQEFYAMEKLRIDTFVVEQQINYHELDAVDLTADHLGFIEDGVCLAYARIFKNGDAVHFGRVATALSARGKGYGKALMKAIIAHCENKWPNVPIEIEAQHQVVGLYEKFGFKSVGDTFILEGIVHQKMIKK